jgi:hypothetical protein
MDVGQKPPGLIGEKGVGRREKRKKPTDRKSQKSQSLGERRGSDKKKVAQGGQDEH